MINISINGWNSKKRTLLKNIKIGDLLMFEMGEGKYSFARVMSKVSLGHVVELLDLVTKSQEIKASDIQNSKRFKNPFIIDSYGLLDKKIEGNWQVVGHQYNFEPSDYENIFFKYGDECNLKKVNIFDEEFLVSKSEAVSMDFYSPKGNADVLEVLGIH